jgi:hypothetical protein
VRDNAARSIRGRGVHLLVRLDQMHFEGSLTAEEEALREPLYQALYDIDEDEIHRILEDDPVARGVLSIPIDGENPWMARAQRLLRSEEPLLRKGSRALPNGEHQWPEFIASLKNLLSENDEYGLHSYSLCEPWKAYRRAYRDAIGASQVVQGETRIGLKITPLST